MVKRAAKLRCLIYLNCKIALILQLYFDFSALFALKWLFFPCSHAPKMGVSGEKEAFGGAWPRQTSPKGDVQP